MERNDDLRAARPRPHPSPCDPSSPLGRAELAELAVAEVALAGNGDQAADTDAVDRLAVVEQPGRVDAAVVEHLAAVLARQRQLEDVVGVAPVLPAVLAEVELIERLARTRAARCAPDWSGSRRSTGSSRIGSARTPATRPPRSPTTTGPRTPPGRPATRT